MFVLWNFILVSFLAHPGTHYVGLKCWILDTGITYPLHKKFIVPSVPQVLLDSGESKRIKPVNMELEGEAPVETEAASPAAPEVPPQPKASPSAAPTTEVKATSAEEPPSRRCAFFERSTARIPEAGDGTMRGLVP